MSQSDGKAPLGGGQPHPPGDDKLASFASSSSEKAMLVEKKHRVSLKTAIKLRIAIIAISIFSVIYLGVMGCSIFVLALTEKNTTAFAFSLDAILDCVSSAVVIWRFCGNTANLYAGNREKVACIILGCLFIVSFMSIVIKSTMVFIQGTHVTKSVVLFSLSVVNSVVCLVLAIVKAIISWKLESISIATDAVNSGIGFILAFVAVIGEVAHHNDQGVWYMDPTVGMVCSVMFLVYGIWLITYEVNKSDRHNNPESHDLSEMK